MRAVDDISAELADLEEALATFRDFQIEPYSGAWLSRRNLEARMSELQEELAVAASRLGVPTLDYIFEGGPLRPGAISAGFLGRAISALQDLVDVVALRAAGPISQRGPLPAPLLAETGLQVAGVVRGSFGVVLRSPLGSVQQSFLTDDIDASTVERAVAQLLDILEEVGTADEERLLGLVADLGPRVVSRLQTFASTMLDDDASVRMVWRSPSQPERDLLFNQSDFLRLREQVTTLEVATNQIEVFGRLGGGSMFRGRFEFQAEGGRIYSGTVPDDVLPLIDTYFNRDCVAFIEATTTSNKLGSASTERFVLLDLHAEAHDRSS